MNIEEIINSLEKFKENENYTKYITIYMIKIENKKKRREKIKTNLKNNSESNVDEMEKSLIRMFVKESNDETIRILFNSLLEQLKTLKRKNIENYDITFSKKNCLELVNISDYGNIQNAVESFNNDDFISVNSLDLDENDFDMYMIKIKNEDINLKFVSKFISTYKIKKSWMIGNLSKEKINLGKKDEVIGLNKKLELIIENDNIILINQAEMVLNKLFNMDDFFQKRSKELLCDFKINRSLGKIFPSEQYERIENKLSGKRFAKKLTKILSNKKRLNVTVENISNIEKIKKDPSHPFYKDIEHVRYDNGQLSVEEGKEEQLLNVLSDGFYTAIISGTHDFDKSIN